MYVDWEKAEKMISLPPQIYITLKLIWKIHHILYITKQTLSGGRSHLRTPVLSPAKDDQHCHSSSSSSDNVAEAHVATLICGLDLYFVAPISRCFRLVILICSEEWLVLISFSVVGFRGLDQFLFWVILWLFIGLGIFVSIILQFYWLPFLIMPFSAHRIPSLFGTISSIHLFPCRPGSLGFALVQDLLYFSLQPITD